MTGLQLDPEALPRDVPAADAIVALWGVTSGEAAHLAGNAQLVAASQTLAQAAGARVVFHMSSAAIYGPGTNLNEDKPPAPPNPYGQSKCDMERAVAQLPPSEITHCCLRLANVVGADSLAPALSSEATTPVSLTQFADGRGPLRSYISPGHLLEVLFALTRLPHAALPDVLNLAASPAVEMQALCQAAGKQVQWKPETPNDHQQVTLDTTRLADLLPDVALHKTASEMISDWLEAEAHI